MQYHALPCNTMQYNAVPCNTMQYHVKPSNTVQYHAIQCNTMQYYSIQSNTMKLHAIPCIIINCWRSVPLPCGQYMAIFSSVRSSNSHPDLLLVQHPLFQITPVLNTGLSLSEPQQLYKGYNAIQRQSLDSMCWLHGCLMGSTGHH